MKLLKPMIWIAVSLLVIFCVYRSWPPLQPRSIGLYEGQLSRCPSSPNCVCSLDADTEHSITPVQFTGSGDAEWKSLVDAVRSMPHVTIINESENYLHAEFRSVLFRFVDDVELHRVPEQSVIQVRSASRTGHSDLGVNRRRLEQIFKLAGITSK